MAGGGRVSNPAAADTKPGWWRSSVRKIVYLTTSEVVMSASASSAVILLTTCRVWSSIDSGTLPSSRMATWPDTNSIRPGVFTSTAWE